MSAQVGTHRGPTQAELAAIPRSIEQRETLGLPCDYNFTVERIFALRRLVALRDFINDDKHPKYKPFQRTPGWPEKRPADWWPPGFPDELKSHPDGKPTSESANAALKQTAPPSRLNPNAPEFTSTSTAGADPQIDSVLLAKSDVLIKAETSLHRMRIERKLKAPAPPVTPAENFDLSTESERAGIELTPPPHDTPDDNTAAKLNAFYGHAERGEESWSGRSTGYIKQEPVDERPGPYFEDWEGGRKSSGARAPSIRGFEPPPPPLPPPPPPPQLEQGRGWEHPYREQEQYGWPRHSSPEYDPAEPYRRPSITSANYNPRRKHSGYRDERERSPIRGQQRSPPMRYRSRSPDYGNRRDRPNPPYYERPTFDRPGYERPPPPQHLPLPPPSPYLPMREPRPPYAGRVPSPPLPPVPREYYNPPPPPSLRGGYKKGPVPYKGKGPRY